MKVIVDPLWGDQEKPIHYYKNYSNQQIYTVSHPQNLDAWDMLHEIFARRYVSKLENKDIA
jgi:hypothetical protein